ncbi:MAG: alpha/beta hydrolase [Anaerolineae bacterium]|nr:alpha/beta hydrolase [Anaerolineae bacterium]
MGKLNHDGVALFFEEAGRGAPPLLFIHGLGSDATFFAPQLAHFQRDHRVVAVDLRGHGQSDTSQKGYAVAGLADDLAWMAYELGLYRPVLVGHGLGGMLAVECAIRCPQLAAAIVTLDLPLPATGEERCGTAMPGRGPALPGWVEQPLRESIRAWDAAAALAQLRLPLLYIIGDASPGDQERLRSTCPQATVEPLIGEKPLDAAIERFLAVALPVTYIGEAI